MPHKLRCSLLCEDVEQEQLFRPILVRLFRRVYVEPRRNNGGFTFVLARLADAVRYLRRRHDEAVGLLVVIDADEAGFHQRHEDIRKTIREAGLDEKSLNRMAVCIPARNVETWELWLCGFRDLDEHGDFKKRFHREVKQSVRRKQLVDAWFAPLSENQRQAEAEILPALARGREEVKRLQGLSNP